MQPWRSSSPYDVHASMRLICPWASSPRHVRPELQKRSLLRDLHCLAMTSFAAVLRCMIKSCFVKLWNSGEMCSSTFGSIGTTRSVTNRSRNFCQPPKSKMSPSHGKPPTCAIFSPPDDPFTLPLSDSLSSSSLWGHQPLPVAAERCPPTSPLYQGTPDQGKRTVSSLLFTQPGVGWGS